MRPRDRAALILVAIALAFATLAVGGAPRWAACGAAFLGIASAIPYVTSRRTASRISPLLFPLIVAASLTALQLVPIPRFLAELIAPAKLELVRDNAAAWGDPAPGWVMASYDPPATLVELAKLAGYLALAWTCVRLSSVRRARHWLAVIVAGVTTLVAVVTIFHALVNARSLYGLYRPQGQPAILGPFVNTNHLAAALALGVPMTLGLAVASSGMGRAGWLIAAVTLVATTLLTGSRGGLVGLIAGVVIVTAILVVQRRAGTDDEDRPLRAAVALPAAIVTLCTIVLLAVFTAGDVAREFRRTSVDEVHETHSKYQVWSESTALIAENRWLGVGKGAFEPAFTRLSPGGRTYAYAENTYLEAVLDWGLPGAALLFLALMSTARIGVRRWRHGPLEAGSISALIGLGIHDIADFSMELPGTVVLVIATGAILFPSRLGEGSDASGGRPRSAAPQLVGARAGALVCGLAIVVAAATPLARAARDEDRSDAGARIAWARHPSDYALAGRAAASLLAARDPRAVAVVQRALALNPRHGGLHQLAGRMLALSQHPEQAPVEFAEAVRWTVDARPVLRDIRSVFAEPEQIAASLPHDLSQMWRVYNMISEDRPVALAYAQRVVGAHPRAHQAHALLATAALAASQPDVALPSARIAWEEAETARNAALLGRALLLTGDRAAAASVLADAAERLAATREERIGLLFLLTDVQVASGDAATAKQTLERASILATGHRKLAIACHLRAATVEEILGNENQADWERSQARALEENQ